jgi:hypothetical protein
MLLLFSCQKSNGNNTVPTDTPFYSANQGTMTLEIDGVPSTATISNIDNSMIFRTQLDYNARDLRIEALIDGVHKLRIVITNWDFQNPPENGIKVKTYNTNTNVIQGPDQECASSGNWWPCDKASVLFSRYGYNYSSESIENEPNGQVTITDSDTNELMVSGNFDFLVLLPNSQEKLRMTGTFTNQKYAILD